MEFNLATIISIISIVFCISTFVLNRKDKSNSEVKEEAGEQSLIKFRLDLLDKKVDKILDKLEQQENETKAIIQEEMSKHILKFHKNL